MKQFIVKHKNAVKGTAAALLIGIILMSFEETPLLFQPYNLQASFDDTLPEKTNESSMKMKDFDKLNQDLNKTLSETDEQIKKIDLDKIQDDVLKSLKDIDLNKILKETERSIQKIDFDKILSDVKSSLKDLNYDDKNSEISLAMNEARKEIEKVKIEISKIDKVAIEKEIAKAKEELEKNKIELKKIDTDKFREEIRNGINKAKEELNQTKAMFTEMEKDGLIDSKQGFTIEYKDKELFINGTKQPENVADKYRKYFSKDHFKIKIDKE
jgi:hypothetical protein